jgi:excisionase family DNA binding protein
MNKEQAANYLGVSTRSIERYAEQGRVTVTYSKQQGRRSIADYSESDLEALKRELEIEIIKTATSPPSPSVPMATFDEMLNLMCRFVVAFEQIEARLQSLMLPGQEKLTLTLTEASSVSGLSKNYLRYCLKNGSLTGAKIGRGWKVRKSELESFI